MTYFFKRLVLVVMCSALLAASSGCAISKQDCLQNDWQTKGYQDGERGKSPDVISTYAKSCAKHGVTPDPTAYAAGFKVGIALYCTAENGVKVGKKNNDYSGACPAELENVFLKNYVAGLRLALDDLEIDYDRQSLKLDEMRANRDRLAIAGKPHATDDKRIKAISGTLSSNTSQRSGINRKIRKWTSFL